MNSVIIFLSLCVFHSYIAIVNSQAVGVACGTGNSCDAGLTCDNNDCKLNAGGDCSSPNSGYCKSGTSCQTDVCTADNTYGGTCSISGGVDSCVTTGGDANAVCTSNICACKATYTGSVGAKCAAANTFGGTCSISGTVDSCVITGGDANAVCTSNICACKATYTGTVGAKCAEANTYGGSCSITGEVDSCVITGGDANAVCTSSKCACKSGYTGSVGAKCYFIRKDGWVLVFRATSQLGTSVYDAWKHVGYHDDYIFTRATMPCGCTSINGSQSCDRHYRSRLLDAWPSTAIDKVRVNIYDNGEEKAFVLFSGHGSTYMSWFSPVRLLQSSWPDLKWSSHNYFSIDGYTGVPHRRFFINHVFPGACHLDKGWMLVHDNDQSGCVYEQADQFPVFVYAAKNSVVTFNSGRPDVRRGDVMAVWVKFRDTVDVDLRQTCMP